MKDLNIRFSADKDKEEKNSAEQTLNAQTHDLDFQFSAKGERIRREKAQKTDNTEEQTVREQTIEEEDYGYDYGSEYELYWEDDPQEEEQTLPETAKEIAKDLPDDDFSADEMSAEEEEDSAAAAVDIDDELLDILEEYSRREESETNNEKALAEEIFEGVASEVKEAFAEEQENAEEEQAQENEEDNAAQVEALSDEEYYEGLSEEEKSELDELKPLIEAAKTGEKSLSSTDRTLVQMSRSAAKIKYDILNLGVVGVIMLFVGVTFIFMNDAIGGADGEKLSLESLKTGEFTASLSETYTSDMPLADIMENANVVVKKLFGESELQFKKKVIASSPDGPIDFQGGDMAVDNEDEAAETTESAPVTTPAETTEKIPQNFSVSRVEDQDGDDGLFTGRPIQTTTTTVTTEPELPEDTERTTTGEVGDIFPSE